MFEIHPEQYQSLLEQKSQTLISLFSDVNTPKLEIYASEPTHYRLRAEFKIWHEGDQLSYVMFDQGKPVEIKNFPQASQAISDLMQPLLKTLEAEQILKHRLFQIDFLNTLNGDMLVTLIYHKKLDEEWLAAAEPLREKFSINIIGRSRKQKLLLGDDYVIEKLEVLNKTFCYQQIENSFTQPNAKVCEKMLSWAVQHSKNSEGDLLELYCGNGNFTIPLSQNFNKVLATEIAKSSVRSALVNLESNQIGNVKIVRLSSEEVTQALNGEREFRRLADINLQEYAFNTVFVDPPRAGLDEKTVQLVSRFDTIIYISCNPHTMLDNIRHLPEHEITQFALFDQFPYTNHMECGVVLKKCDNI